MQFIHNASNVIIRTHPKSWKMLWNRFRNQVIQREQTINTSTNATFFEFWISILFHFPAFSRETNKSKKMSGKYWEMEERASERALPPWLCSRWDRRRCSTSLLRRLPFSSYTLSLSLLSFASTSLYSPPASVPAEGATHIHDCCSGQVSRAQWVK